jgi:transcriptional regulator
VVHHLYGPISINYDKGRRWQSILKALLLNLDLEHLLLHHLELLLELLVCCMVEHIENRLLH